MRSIAFWLACSLCALVMVMSGCVADGPAPPKPKASPPPAPSTSTMTVDRIVLSADPFSEDRDGNGFYDTIKCVIYLFPPPEQHHMPFHDRGTAWLELRDDEGYSVAKWTIRPDAFDSLRGMYNGLPGYFVALNISEVADDRILRRKGELWCRFTPEATGTEIRGAQPVTIQQLGPTGESSLRREQ